MPAIDPEVKTSSTSFNVARVKLHEKIPSLVSSIGKSLMITPLTEHDMFSRLMAHGESSFGPSLQYAKKVLKSVLSSWVKTLSFGHLEAGFGMIKHVQDIFTDSEEVGLDIASAKDFVDEVIALGNKWTESKNFPNGNFFSEMFLEPSGEVKSEMDEISRT